MATVADLQAEVAALGVKIEEIAVLVVALRASQGPGGISEADLDAVRVAIAALSVRADEILA
jgi:hypothetical protein